MSTPEPAAKAHPGGVLAGRKILVAEDDPIQSRIVAQALQKVGATVACVRDGKAARDLLLSGGVDVLVTDWMMPEMDGIEVARHLRGIPGRPFVILLSALNMPDAKLHALRAGADEFISKPIVAPKLVEAVAQGALKRSQAGGLPGKTEEPDKAAAVVDTNHPIARTKAWKELPAIIGGMVGEMLQVSPKIVVHQARSTEPGIRCVLPLIDSEHLMELHLRLEASRADAMQVGLMMLGDPAPEDEPTLTDLVSEVANIAAGGVKTALIAEGFPFTLGLASRVEGTQAGYALADQFGLRADRAYFSVSLGVRPRNAVAVPAIRLREGMVLAESLFNDGGALILPVGTRLTSTVLARLLKLLGSRQLRVCVPDTGG